MKYFKTIILGMFIIESIWVHAGLVYFAAEIIQSHHPDWCLVAIMQAVASLFGVVFTIAIGIYMCLLLSEEEIGK